MKALVAAILMMQSLAACAHSTNETVQWPMSAMRNRDVESQSWTPLRHSPRWMIEQGLRDMIVGPVASVDLYATSFAEATALAKFNSGHPQMMPHDAAWFVVVRGWQPLELKLMPRGSGNHLTLVIPGDAPSPALRAVVRTYE